ncbi:MAG: tail fiber protein [Alphaproteobacteria bacterium]|nr:tail fiber protein [Alphaproteobacteria bacterium]
MADAFVGEIKLVAFQRNLTGWYPCDGRVVPISGNEPLFALLGVTYGGDGRTTFGLPDLRGRVPVCFGQGTGLTNNWIFGQPQGTEMVTLTQAMMPTHNHNLMVSTDPTTTDKVNGQMLSTPADANEYLYTKASFGTAAVMAGSTVAPAPSVGNQPHSNMMPSIALEYMICAQGIFPEKA